MRYVGILLLLASTAAQGASGLERLNKNRVALCADRNSKEDADCFDPVSYFAEKSAVKVGAENSKKFRFAYKGATYVFASEEHLNLFKKQPERYLPQFGGWCAYAVAEKKEKVDIDPASFVVQEGRLLLFYNGFFADTRKTWLNDKSKSPKAYLGEADANWPATQGKEP